MKEAKDFKLPDYQPYEDEIWIDFMYSDKYVISNYGRVKHRNRRKCVTPCCSHGGNQLYKIAYRDNNCKPHDTLLGPIVAKHFVKNPHNYEYIRYKDGDRYNNTSSNIEWSEVRQEHNKPVVLNDEGRTCTICQEFKSWDNFYNSKRGIRGKLHTCSDCLEEYRMENYEHNQIIKQIYYYDNREEISQKSREYNAANKEKLAKKSKKYREENKETIKERRKKQPTKYILFKDRLTVEEDPRFNRVGELEVKCAYCREYFKPSYSHTMSRVWALNSDNATENRLYCSNECKLSCSVFNTRDHYRGTKNYKDRQINTTIRREVKERDNYECQICGSTENVEAHHIVPWALDEDIADEMDNNITLCRNCHRWVHRNIPGCNYRELRVQEDEA